MANLKEVRERISSVISTQKITKAMKMVAAAKLRRAQQAIVDLRPYSNKLSAILSNIMSNLGDDAGTSYGEEREPNKVVMVVITSNRGLCGAYNANVLKKAVRHINENYAEQRAAGNLTILPIGKKANDFFKSRHADITRIEDYVEVVGRDFSFDDSLPISTMLMDGFNAGDYDRIDIVYAQFKNAATQIFDAERFLPVAKLETSEEESLSDYIFEPNQVDILDHLVPTILRTQFHKSILDANASEHGARMTAMDKATENADELLRDLRIGYNKARQEAITRELSEIVGGAAALESA